jgi:glycosyltransferase involved in cell wall biosynthesis
MMSHVRSRPRVVMLYAGWPADPSYLEILDSQVDLIVYHSGWLPGRAVPSTPPVPVRSRSFAPVVRSARGHLSFLYRGLRAALDQDRPDVIHVVSEPWGLLCVQAGRWVRANNARLVMHGCDTIWHHGSRPERLIRRLLLRTTLRVPGGFVAENRKALDLAAANGQPAHNVRARIHTNPRDVRTWRLPTDPERAAARSALGLGPDTVAVGFLGRLVPEKGVRQFLDAAGRLLRDGADMRFFVAGSGPLEAELRSRVSSGITRLGSLSHPGGVRRFFHALDVFACPSLSTPFWEDQGPRALLEAMMCGCIPVGTATGGIPEMLGGQGFLASTTASEAIAAAICDAGAASGQATERQRVSAAAAALYSDRAVAAQLLDAWRAALAVGATGAASRTAAGTSAPDPRI